MGPELFLLAFGFVFTVAGVLVAPEDPCVLEGESGR
jgi:hypothetical protein